MKTWVKLIHHDEFGHPNYGVVIAPSTRGFESLKHAETYAKVLQKLIDRKLFQLDEDPPKQAIKQTNVYGGYRSYCETCDNWLDHCNCK